MEFTPVTEIGQKVWRININLNFNGKGCALYSPGIHIEELSIVHQTDYKIALTDKWITTLDRKKKGNKKESYNHYLNELSIYVKNKETYFSNGIFSTVYSTKKPTEAVLNKYKNEIKETIQKEYSFVGNIEELLNNLK